MRNVTRAMIRWLTTAVVLSAVATLPGITATALAQKAAVKPTVLATFDTPGVYTWTVPPRVRTITFDVFGASGGDSIAANNALLASGGAGGEATATFAVQPGQVFQIYVGGRGRDGQANVWGYPGFNGGGGGTPGNFPNDPMFAGGGGGGGSDVRLGGYGNPCASDIVWLPCTYSGRIVVGGGGGGATNFGYAAAGVDGGAGGGLTGLSVPDPLGGGGSGGGQDADYNCNTSDVGCGTFGQGGQWSPWQYGWGGGGGGWYGGTAHTFSAYSAGGGSGFISPFALSGSFPGGTRWGNGLVIIRTP